MQRPWDRTVPGMLEEQPGGWSRLSKEERGRRGGEGSEGTGQVVQGLVGSREDLGFYPEGGGSPGGL